MVVIENGIPGFTCGANIGGRKASRLALTAGMCVNCAVALSGFASIICATIGYSWNGRTIYKCCANSVTLMHTERKNDKAFGTA